METRRPSHKYRSAAGTSVHYSENATLAAVEINWTCIITPPALGENHKDLICCCFFFVSYGRHRRTDGINKIWLTASRNSKHAQKNGDVRFAGTSLICKRRKICSNVHQINEFWTLKNMISSLKLHHTVGPPQNDIFKITVINQPLTERTAGTPLSAFLWSLLLHINENITLEKIWKKPKSK